MTRAVDRAVRMLLALASGTPRLGVSEIATLVDIPKPTVYTMLRTLERHGLVVQEADGGKYALGPAVLQLGNSYLDGSELRVRSATWADLLARQSGEAVWVGVLSGRNLVVVHHALRPDDLVQILEVGAAVPWHACALGRAIVASMDDDRQKELLTGPLPRLTGRTVTDPEAVRDTLAATREQGYAVEDQEATLGDAGLAAPVFDWSGRVVGAHRRSGRPSAGGGAARAAGRRGSLHRPRAVARPRRRAYPGGRLTRGPVPAGERLGCRASLTSSAPTCAAPGSSRWTARRKLL